MKIHLRFSHLGKGRVKGKKVIEYIEREALAFISSSTTAWKSSDCGQKEYEGKVRITYSQITTQSSVAALSPGKVMTESA